MNDEPQVFNGGESIRFKADINGNSVIVDVSREVIEDHLAVEATTPDERLDFVRRSRNQIVEHVSAYLRQAPDVTGIHLTTDQLKHCK